LEESTVRLMDWFKALSLKYESFSVIQIDAHFDLRKAYEDYEHSHASIMYNLSQLEACKQIVHIGIRDYCEEEEEEAKSNQKSVTFFDHTLKSNRYKGISWDKQCEIIVNAIHEKYIYLSFDIDGLDPKLCSGTGTPVPGGLEFHEAFYLLNKIVESGKIIIGADLCEVSNLPHSDFDANIGARVLFKMCNLLTKSKLN
jgi:agmatinase